MSHRRGTYARHEQENICDHRCFFIRDVCVIGDTARGECRDARSSYHGRATPERGNEALSTTLPRLPCALYPNDRYCLQLGGRHATPNHIRLLMDCAQMCTTTVAYMARESSLHDRLCGLCSEMCRLCAESCEQTAGNEQMVKQCAELCRRCLASCERMASKGGGIAS